MINNANNNQQSLLSIIDKLFVYTIDPQTNKKQIRVSPTLTESGLQELIVMARGLIIKLYLTCEVDYVTGLKLYEVIVEQKIFETKKNQKTNLKQKEQELQLEENAPIPVPAEFAELQAHEKEKIEETTKQIQELTKQVQEEKAIAANPMAANMEQPKPIMEQPQPEAKPNMEQLQQQPEAKPIEAKDELNVEPNMPPV